MKGTELILKALHAKGVKYIFGYTGGTIMPVIDEMDKQDLFTFVMPRHEQGATGVRGGDRGGHGALGAAAPTATTTTSFLNLS